MYNAIDFTFIDIVSLAEIRNSYLIVNHRRSAVKLCFLDLDNLKVKKPRACHCCLTVWDAVSTVYALLHDEATCTVEI